MKSHIYKYSFHSHHVFVWAADNTRVMEDGKLSIISRYPLATRLIAFGFHNGTRPTLGASFKMDIRAPDGFLFENLIDGAKQSEPVRRCETELEFLPGDVYTQRKEVYLRRRHEVVSANVQVAIECAARVKQQVKPQKRKDPGRFFLLS